MRCSTSIAVRCVQLSAQGADAPRARVSALHLDKPMTTKDRFVSGAVVAAMLFGLALVGCEKAGPAEQAGKAVDNAVEKAGKQMEKAGDAVEDAVERDKK